MVSQIVNCLALQRATVSATTKNGFGMAIYLLYFQYRGFEKTELEAKSPLFATRAPEADWISRIAGARAGISGIAPATRKLPRCRRLRAGARTVFPAPNSNQENTVYNRFLTGF
jgi:hypothetical protein